MKNKEIERKFIVEEKNIPFDIKNMPYQDIIQGYIEFENNLTFRLKNTLYRNVNGEPIGEEWTQNIKGKNSKVRDEYEIRLLRDQFSKLWKLCDKNSLHKFRYDPPFDGGNMDLDCFKNDLRGLWLVELEFDSIEDCDSFEPLKWFGKEVTEDMRYSNLNLVKFGLPKNNDE